jgi:hypothetical protein
MGWTATQLPQEVFRRHKERVGLKDPSDDHHRVRSHHINHDVPPKSAEIIGLTGPIFRSHNSFVSASY